MHGPRPPRKPAPEATPASTTSARAKGRGRAALPLWRSIVRSLERDIVSGRLPEGSRLATEAVLARQFDVNRHTLRRAVAELGKKGLVRTVPNSGTFVARLRVPFRLGPTSSIADAIELAGFATSARLLSQRICIAPPEIAKQLMLAYRTPVQEFTLLRYANDMPATYVTAWLPADRFPGLAKQFELTGSLRRAILKTGIAAPRRKSTRIMSRIATSDECEMLGLDAGAILLTLEVVDADQAGEPIAVFLYRFSALRAEFVIDGEPMAEESGSRENQ